MPLTPPVDIFIGTRKIFTASEIGSNLCDVFKIDKEHIAIFFADVIEKGVVQGLYMMKAKNMLKKAITVL